MNEQDHVLPPYAAPASQHDTSLPTAMEIAGALQSLQASYGTEDEAGARYKAEKILSRVANNGSGPISSLENDLKFWRLLDESQRAAARNAEQLGKANKDLIEYLDSLFALPDAASVRQIHSWMERATRAEEAYVNAKFDLDAHEHLCQSKDAEIVALRAKIDDSYKQGFTDRGRSEFNPAPEPWEKAGQWISVDDGHKPEERKPILLFVRTLTHGEDDEGRPYEAEGEEVAMGEYRHNKGAPYFDCYTSPMSDNDWVTHWMPLPAAPQTT